VVVIVCHPGELRIDSSDSHAGLTLDTKFDIGNRVKLPFDDEWFALAPNRRFGAHPKRGKLNLDDNDLKRRLSSAIAELKKADRPKAVDMITRTAGRKKPKL
jgi:hypothetical protein